MNHKIFKNLFILLIFLLSLSLGSWYLSQHPQYFENLPVLGWLSKNDHNKPLTAFAKADTLDESLELIEKHYYDKNRLNPETLLKDALETISKSVTEIMIKFSESGRSFDLQVEDAKIKLTYPNFKKPSDILPTCQKVFAFIEAHYHGNQSLSDIEYLSINGALTSLDPHSNLLPPKDFSEFKTQTEGEFGGIGIVIGMREANLVVIAPLPETPAWRAGIKSKDRIVQIGDQSTINMGLSEAVDLMRGKVGTHVSLTLQRDSQPNPFTVNLNRAIIKITSVDGKLISQPQGDIVYLRIKSFQEETFQELKNKLKALSSKTSKLVGAILDLRNNPGGLLTQAIDISDLFLEQGTIVITVGADDKIRELDEARAFGTVPNFPLAVLVNEGSASASEIVSGALKNNTRSVIIGSQTFGKGSVQSVYTLRDGSALKLTIAQYLTPGNESIQSVGITPDVNIHPSVVNDKLIKLTADDGFSEKDLEQHLSSQHNLKRISEYQLSYFYEKDPDAEDNNTEYDSALSFLDKDFSVQLASQMILTCTNSTRDIWLKNSKDLIQSFTNQENTKIQTALQKLNIDWSEGAVDGKPQAEVRFELLNLKNQMVNNFKAGEEYYLKIYVKNNGNGDFYRLLAKASSDFSIFKNREFIFGNVKAGEEKTFQVKLKIPESVYTREDKLLLNFTSEDKKIPEPFQFYIKIEALERPQFSYRYMLYDDGQFSSSGNGNHKIDPGEKISLNFEIFNEGSGPSKETFINLKNTEGELIFLDKGREKLEVIEPAKSKTALLQFKVNAKYEKKDIKFDLNILDNKSVEVLQQDFVLGVNKVLALSNEKHQGPVITLQPSEYPTISKNKTIKLQFKVHDSNQLKAIMVFVNDDKDFLQFNAPNVKMNEQSFQSNLSLDEKKNNLITILAQDREGLFSRKSFYMNNP